MKDTDQKLLWESYLESKRPDYPDVDDDGDKKESMEKTLKDKEDGDVAEENMDVNEDELTEFEKKRLKLSAKKKTDTQKKGEADQNKAMEQDLKEEFGQVHLSELEMKEMLIDMITTHIEQSPPEDMDTDSLHKFSIDQQLTDSKNYIRDLLDEINANEIDRLQQVKRTQHDLKSLPEHDNRPIDRPQSREIGI